MLSGCWSDDGVFNLTWHRPCVCLSNRSCNVMHANKSNLEASAEAGQVT